MMEGIYFYNEERSEERMKLWPDTDYNRIEKAFVRHFREHYTNYFRDENPWNGTLVDEPEYKIYFKVSVATPDEEELFDGFEECITIDFLYVDSKSYSFHMTHLCEAMQSDTTYLDVISYIQKKKEHWKDETVQHIKDVYARYEKEDSELPFHSKEGDAEELLAMFPLINACFPELFDEISPPASKKLIVLE